MLVELATHHCVLCEESGNTFFTILLDAKSRKIDNAFFEKQKNKQYNPHAP